jgi:O-antigen/teichoic acid export membrane protein
MNNLKNSAYQALKRTETIFKTDMIYLARGGFWLGLGQVLSALGGFALSLVFAHFLTKESFGIYKYILSVTGIVSALTLSGIGFSLTRSVAKGAELLRSVVRLNFKWSIGILLSGIVLCIYYYTNDNFTLSYAFLLMALTVPVSISVNLYSSYLLGKKDFKRNTQYTTIANLATSLAIILAVLFTGSIAVVVTAYFLSTTLIGIILYKKTLQVYKPHEDGGEEILSLGKHLSFLEIIGRIASQLDRILIFHYLGAAPLAIYAFAVSPVEQLQSGKKIFGNLVMPKLAGRPFEELQKSTPRKALIALIYALVLAGIWIIAAPYFYKTFFPQYVDSIFYSQVYSFTLIAIAGTIFNETLVSHARIKELYIHRTFTPILKASLFFILLPHLGVLGMIVTHITVICASILLAFYFVKRPFKTSASNTPSTSETL